MSLKAIGFDLDDTLYSRREYYAMIFNSMQESVVNIDVSFDEFYPVYQKYSDLEYELFIQRKKSKDDYRIDRVIRTYQSFGQSISRNDGIIFNALYLYYRSHIVLRQGVVELLESLIQNNYQLFILTNGPSVGQRQKLALLEIERFIPENYWYISDELNNTKPNPSIFQEVEERLGYQGDQIMYIGDHYQNDILGPKQLNWQTAWLKLDEEEKIAEETYVISEMTDLMTFFDFE